MTFEELKQQFIDNGFQVNGESFVHEKIDGWQIINGQRFPQKSKFEMTFLCEGGFVDIDDSDPDDIYSFEILGPGRKPVYTICIKDFEDFTLLTK